MALPPLATEDDLAIWLGSAVESGRAGAVLSAVSSLVRSEAGRTWEDDEPPDEVVAMVVDVAGHIYRNPAAIRQVSTGPFSESYAITQGLSLTDAQKAILRRYSARARGLWSLSTTRGDSYDDTIYVPVVGTATPFPWYAASDPLLP